jgi:cytochrome c55X
MEKRLMHLKIGFSIAILLTTFLLIAPASALDEPLSGVRQQQLIHLLKQDCGSCHGMTLKGGLGPALLPKDLINKPTVFLKNTILYGRPGTAMPPWQGLLTEQESLWLVEQLQQGLKND